MRNDGGKGYSTIGEEIGDGRGSGYRGRNEVVN